MCSTIILSVYQSVCIHPYDTCPDICRSCIHTTDIHVTYWTYSPYISMYIHCIYVCTYYILHIRHIYVTDVYTMSYTISYTHQYSMSYTYVYSQYTYVYVCIIYTHLHTDRHTYILTDSPIY